MKYLAFLAVFATGIPVAFFCAEIWLAELAGFGYLFLAAGVLTVAVVWTAFRELFMED